MRRSVLACGVGIAVLTAAGAASAQTSPFSQMVVFGDSLSDVGNVSIAQGLSSRDSFTTNPGRVTVEVVADHYALPLGPSLGGGTNQALGGAGFINNAPGTPAGIPTVSSQVGAYLTANPQLDGNALYTVFGGGNDVNFATNALLGGGVTLPVATANMQAAGTRALDLVTSLQNAGAKTIIVINVPNVGQTPSAQAANGVVPGASTLIAGLAQAVNTTLNTGLAGRHGIVPVNAYALLDETIADPAAFGLTNVRGLACTTPSSFTCSASTLAAPGADQTWLFADGIHPTTAGHASLAAVILSELAAPQQISLLAEAPLAVSASHRAVTSMELEDGVDGSRLFGHASYDSSRYQGQGDALRTEGETTAITIGGILQPFDGLAAGAALTLGSTETDFGSRGGGFDADAMLFSIFARHRIGERAYVSADAYAGDLDFDNVDRIIDLGASARQERGSTAGTSTGVGLAGGYWFGRETMRHGPFASVNYQRVRVDGYREDGQRSTAMTFSNQTRESFVTEIGYAVSGRANILGMNLTPYGSASYNMESKDDPSLVTAGLVTMNGTFSMEGYTPSEDWIALRAGVGAELSSRIHASFGAFGRVADDAQDQYGLTAGLSMRF